MKNTIKRYGFPHDFTWKRAKCLSFWKGAFICSWLGHQVNIKGYLWCGRCGLYYGEFVDMHEMGKYFGRCEVELGSAKEEDTQEIKQA